MLSPEFCPVHLIELDGGHCPDCIIERLYRVELRAPRYVIERALPLEEPTWTN